MNPSEEQHFLDLATKVIANRATGQERQEFEALLSESDEHRDRFEVFKADVIVAKDIVSLIDASEAKGAGLNEKQFARLKDEVSQLAAKAKAKKQKRRSFPILIFLGLLFTVGVLIHISRNRPEMLTNDDISTPDGIISITINMLNNR